MMQVVHPNFVQKQQVVCDLYAYIFLKRSITRIKLYFETFWFAEWHLTRAKQVIITCSRPVVDHIRATFLSCDTELNEFLVLREANKAK